MNQKYKNFFKTTGLILFTITKYTAGALVVLFAWFYEMQKSDSQKDMERKERLRRAEYANDPRRKRERLLYQGTIEEVLDALPKRVTRNMQNFRRMSAGVAKVYAAGDQDCDKFSELKDEIITHLKNAFSVFGDEFEIREVSFGYDGVRVAIVQNT